MGCQGSKDAHETEKKGPTLLVGPHLNKAEDLTEMPAFPEGTKSLLSKYLTR